MYPEIKNINLVGSYDAVAKAGGGYVWDDVLEYRVWCYPSMGAKDLCGGDDYFYSFDNCEEAIMFSEEIKGANEPLALIIQHEYIDESEEGEYVHKKEQRIAEWPIEFLLRPKRDKNTIPNFLNPDAPKNRLDIIRGLAT